LLVAVSAVLTKGNYGEVFGYLAGRESYTGNALSKDRILVKDEALLQSIIHDENFQDYRKRLPKFSVDPKKILRSKTTPMELQAYKAFLAKVAKIKEEDNERRSYQSAEKITSLVHEYYKRNLTKGRDIEGNVLGKNKSHPEDYVYQLVNAKTYCGTVGESVVAVMRELGYSARLVILAIRPKTIQANHVFAEVFVPEKNQWIMIDPMIDYTGTQSAFELIQNPKSAKETSDRHSYGSTIYNSNTVIWFDRRGFNRKIFYFTSKKENFPIVQAGLSKL
jgi:hypothetical protein